MSESNIKFSIIINDRPELEKLPIKAKLKMLEKLVDETAGCGSYLLCSGKRWSMKFTKTDWQFSGTHDQVITAAIKEITENRKPNDNPRNKKPFRY